LLNVTKTRLKCNETSSTKTRLKFSELSSTKTRLKLRRIKMTKTKSKIAAKNNTGLQRNIIQQHLKLQPPKLIHWINRFPYYFKQIMKTRFIAGLVHSF